MLPARSGPQTGARTILPKAFSAPTTVRTGGGIPPLVSLAGTELKRTKLEIDSHEHAATTLATTNLERQMNEPTV